MKKLIFVLAAALPLASAHAGDPPSSVDDGLDRLLISWDWNGTHLINGTFDGDNWYIDFNMTDGGNPPLPDQILFQYRHKAAPHPGDDMGAIISHLRFFPDIGTAGDINFMADGVDPHRGTAGHTDQWLLEIVRVSANPGENRVFFDIRHVPAPGTAALLGLGGLMASRRRRA